MSEITKPKDDGWATWKGDQDYGRTLYRRAIGELPEMESSKVAARRVKAAWRSGETVLDVGCGAGHYLVSLRRELGPGFSYTGADATPQYVELARKAFTGDSNAKFENADIFNLPFPDASFDIVICNNVLLHLPSIARPLKELARVAKRLLIVRMLCGDRTFLIRDVWAGSPEIDDDGHPAKFNHFNIYSQACVRDYLAKAPRVSQIDIEADRDFNADNIKKSGAENDNRFNSTTVLGAQQVNGYILQPWAFVTATLNPASGTTAR